MFGERQHGFVFAVEQHVHIPLFETLHRARDDVVQFSRVFIVDRVALGFTDALNDDLLRRLRGNAAKVFGSHFFVEVVAGLVLRAGFFRGNLELRIGDLFGHDAPVKDFVLAGLPVDGDDGVGFASEMALVSGEQRGFQCLDQHLERNVAFPRDELEDVEKAVFGHLLRHAVSFDPWRA